MRKSLKTLTKIILFLVYFVLLNKLLALFLTAFMSKQMSAFMGVLTLVFMAVNIVYLAPYLSSITTKKIFKEPLKKEEVSSPKTPQKPTKANALNIVLSIAISFFVLYGIPYLIMSNCSGWNAGSGHVTSCLIDFPLLRDMADRLHMLVMVGAMTVVPLIIYLLLSVRATKYVYDWLNARAVQEGDTIAAPAQAAHKVEEQNKNTLALSDDIVNALLNQDIDFVKSFFTKNPGMINYVYYDTNSTPLILATLSGNNQIVDFLLTIANIDIKYKNKYSQTALMLAQERGFKDIELSLTQYQG